MGTKVVGTLLFNLMGGLAYITAWVNSIETWKHLIMFVIGVVFLCIKIKIYYYTMLTKEMEYQERKAHSDSSIRRLKREEGAGD